MKDQNKDQRFQNNFEQDFSQYTSESKSNSESNNLYEESDLNELDHSIEYQSNNIINFQENDQIQSKFLALTNYQWYIIKPQDIFNIIHTFISQSQDQIQGKIISVKLLQSKYGEQQEENDNKNGPDIYGPDKKMDEKKLQSYEQQKLKYYYCIIEFDNNQTANFIFENLSNLEIEQTNNIFEFSFVPEDLQINQIPMQICDQYIEKQDLKQYHINPEGHTKLELTWEKENLDYQNLFKKNYTEQDLDKWKDYIDNNYSEDLDLSDALESQSESDWKNDFKKKSKIQDKYEILLQNKDDLIFNQDIQQQQKIKKKPAQKYFIEKKEKSEQKSIFNNQSDERFNQVFTNKKFQIDLNHNIQNKDLLIKQINQK